MINTLFEDEPLRSRVLVYFIGGIVDGLRPEVCVYDHPTAKGQQMTRVQFKDQYGVKYAHDYQSAGTNNMGDTIFIHYETQRGQELFSHDVQQQQAMQSLDGQSGAEITKYVSEALFDVVERSGGADRRTLSIKIDFREPGVALSSRGYSYESPSPADVVRVMHKERTDPIGKRIRGVRLEGLKLKDPHCAKGAEPISDTARSNFSQSAILQGAITVMDLFGYTMTPFSAHDTSASQWTVGELSMWVDWMPESDPKVPYKTWWEFHSQYASIPSGRYETADEALAVLVELLPRVKGI